MITAREISELLTELGPVADYAAVVANNDGKSWRIAVDEDTLIELELDAENGLLIFDADIGNPPPKFDEASLYKLLLNYNGLRSRTGGVNIAVTGEGIVTMTFAAAAYGIERSQLSNMIKSLATVHGGWRSVVANFNAANTIDDISMSTEGFIRD